ncbi:kinase-like domain-containing protein [Hyaloraphidium curvatum]|nr:kinase-like domain-containing protein [Hyaloraphidium curvatum]
MDAHAAGGRRRPALDDTDGDSAATLLPDAVAAAVGPCYSAGPAAAAWGIDAHAAHGDQRVPRKEVPLAPMQTRLRSVLEAPDAHGRLPAPGKPANNTPLDLPPLPALPHPADPAHSRRSCDVPQQRPQVQRSGSEGFVKPVAGRVGPWILGRTLGSGSVGKVKLATHKDTGQRVAIKIVPKEEVYKDDRKGAPRKRDHRLKLEREVAIMKLIKHPNVLELYDVYESDTDLFLVLELVEGGELFDYLVSRGRLPEPEALHFFQQIIGGLSYCHSHLVCHRDLKPENLLLDPSCRRVKIADFGMANLQLPSRLLQTSCGSPHYASPEVIRGVQYDGAGADIWSCGVILYALLTGGLPFDDPDIKRLLAKVKTGVYVVPGRDICSPQCQDLIARMLTVDPANRIGMRDIVRHPFFTSRAPPPASVVPSVLGSGDWPAVPAEHLDADLVRQLAVLGWGTPAQIAARLGAEEASLDKAFYELLGRRQREGRERRAGRLVEAPAKPHAAEERPHPPPRRAPPPKIAIPTADEAARLSQPAAYEGTTPRFHRPVRRSGSGASEASLTGSASPKRSWFANLFFGRGEGMAASPSASSASDAESMVSDGSAAAPDEDPGRAIRVRVGVPSDVGADRAAADVAGVLAVRGARAEHVPHLGAWLCWQGEAAYVLTLAEGEGGWVLEGAPRNELARVEVEAVCGELRARWGRGRIGRALGRLMGSREGGAGQ